jgi:hypothetical protein
MDTLPRELVCTILTFASEYEPFIRKTCPLWDDAMDTVVANGRSKPALTIPGLAERGHTALIRLVGNADLSINELCQSMYKAAFGGHVDTMTLLKDWGAVNYDSALWAFANAAAGGSIKAMNLLNTWGATDYDFALAKGRGKRSYRSDERAQALGSY